MISPLDDLRHAVRSLAHAKGFAAVAVLTLAIGVGGSTLIFALVDGILLEPLPVREPDRLIVAWKRTPTGTFSHYPFGADAVREVAQNARSFELVGAFAYNGAMQFAAIEQGVASYITSGVVDGAFFRVLDLVPLVGRTLAPEDDVNGAEPVLVIDERLWQRRYGRAPDVIGKRLRLFDQNFAIVGVVPTVDLPRGAEAWITLTAAGARSTNPASRVALRRDQDLVARLRPGVTLGDATAELEAFTADFEGRANRRIVASVKPYVEEVIGELRAPVRMLFGATLMVLLIACANVANLLLLRGEERRAQFALRIALGASRWRLARQVAAEAMVVGTVGGAVGLLVAFWSLDAVIAFAPAGWPRLDLLHLDRSAVLFSALVVALATAGVSVLPACFSTTGGGATLNSGSTRVTPAAFRRGRRALVVTQVALTIAILSVAGVLTRTLWQLQSTDMGFAAHQLTFVELFLPPGRYEDAKLRRPFFEELASRAKAIPGVDAAVPIAVRPYAGLSGWDMPRWVAEGQGPDDAVRNPGLDLQSVYPDHFETMVIPIVSGRALNRFDREGATPVAVISENAARQVWPGESAVGKRFKWGGVESDVPWVTIVGVAATTRYRELAEPRASVYLPAGQFIDGANSLALRLSVPAGTIAGALRERVQELDANVFVLRTQTFSETVAGPLARPRFLSFLGSVFGGTALLLAAVGLYGMLAAFVRHSTREIGVRMALGADARRVGALVLGEASRLAGVGVILGFAFALASTRLVRGLLFGVDAIDPLTWLTATVVVLLAMLAACYVPLRRATRVDPVTLLRTN